MSYYVLLKNLNSNNNDQFYLEKSLKKFFSIVNNCVYNHEHKEKE